MNRLKTILHRYSCLTLCLFTLFVALLPFVVQAEEKAGTKQVRVGWYADVYNYTGKNGERSGYFYEYEQALAGYTGWNYQYFSADWANLLQMVQNGQIDIMAGVSYTDERARTMLFSELPMGEEKYYIYADLKNTDISISDLQTLNGKRIGVLEKSVQTKQLYEWTRAHNIQLKYVFVDSFEDARAKFAAHELDCTSSVENPAWVKAGLTAVAPMGRAGIYFAVNKNRPDLKAELDNAMRRMEYEKPFFAEELYQKYISAASAPFLYPEEEAWLAKHGAIRIGCLKNDYGFSRIDSESGEIVGVINDYISFAENCLGNNAISFKVESFNSFEEQLQALQDNKIDMIFHVNQNPYAAEQLGLNLSNTVLTAPLVALTVKEQFDEHAENIVAVKKGDVLSRWYISYNYPQWHVVEYISYEDVQKAVQDGKADCFVVKLDKLAAFLENKDLHSFFLTRAGNASFAVKRENTTLLSILNKTLDGMPSSVFSGALSLYEHRSEKVTLKNFIRDNHFIVVCVVTAIFTVILVIFLCLLRKARIAERNAKQADEAKTNFLFNMSHDIRTPMNALLGYSKLMKERMTDPVLLDYQSKMEQSGNLLLSIINNVLDMARIESGKIEVDETYNEVGTIVQEVRDVFAMEAAKKNISITHEAHVQHEHIMCDATKVKEIFTNLVSNAIKYTPEGGSITLLTEELPCDRPGYVKMQTDVMDTGIGMSKEYLPSLFEPFTRERNTTVSKVIGTGLGMPIVKKLVEQMGGNITVESELGRGSKFSVTMMFKIADEAFYKKLENTADSKAGVECLRGKRILMAEDNDLNAEIAMYLLKKMGLEVERVADGVQCVSKMQEQPAGIYDLILMDVQMPNMDGYQATKNIRGFADKAKAEIPIVAMTANAFKEDRENAAKAGMNGHISKPIDAKKIEQTLIRLLG